MEISTRRLPANRMLISRRAFMSPETISQEIQLPEDITQEKFELDLSAWCSGEVLIQEALPYIHTSEREFILSGCTPAQWLEIFPEEEEVWA